MTNYIKSIYKCQNKLRLNRGKTCLRLATFANFSVTLATGTNHSCWFLTSVHLDTVIRNSACPMTTRTSNHLSSITLSTSVFVAVALSPIRAMTLQCDNLLSCLNLKCITNKPSYYNIIA